MLCHMPNPTKEQFNEIEKEFNVRWNFPNVLGCLDGKHIRLQCPDNSGSLYYNYKDFFSMVLFALVDSIYKFIAIDVGSFGREGDAGIFLKTKLGNDIRNQLFDTPTSKVLPGTDSIAPHVFLGDEAFPLLNNLLKPYARPTAAIDRTKTIFNYRLSRARRLVENAFGILTQRFRIFLTPIQMNTATVENLITSACIIHNLLVDEQPISENSDLPTSQLDSYSDTNDSSDLNAQAIRDIFRSYFNGVGIVSWQNRILGLEDCNFFFFEINSNLKR